MNAMDAPIGSPPLTAGGHFTLHFYAAAHALAIRLRTIAGDEETFAEVLSAHPFLNGYLAEMATALPGGDPFAARPADWAAAIDRHAALCPETPPLAALRAAGLSSEAVELLMLVGLAEEDARFGDLFAWLQGGTGARRLTLGLAERILAPPRLASPGADGGAWRQLEAWGLIRPVDRDAPRAEMTLAPPPALWAMIRGEGSRWPPAGTLAPPADPADWPPVFPEPVQRRLEEAARLLAAPRPVTLALRGDSGLDLARLSAGLLAPGGRRALLLRGVPDPATGAQLAAWCVMAGAAPVFRLELGPGATAEGLRPPAWRGPVIVAPGEEGGVSPAEDETLVTLALPPLDPDLRRRVWTAAFRAPAPVLPAPSAGPAPGLDPDLLETLDGLRVSAGYARRIAESAALEARLAGRPAPAPEDVRAAARALNHQLLDGLAERIETGQGWDSLVVAPSTMAALRELERMARGRERLAGRMGPAFDGAGAAGVRALFTGVSGAGKTMSARILAGALGKDLYRVDLAAVVNKYIGETEKNLDRVLSRAEALDVVLLLDEGDALMGARTEVKSANDRYANLETNYLLQRLERYRGIILVTTNYGDNVDKAFQRRMDVVAAFLRPDADQRQAILGMHLPEDHAVSPRLLREAALRCDLTGGQWRNVALRAALSAMGSSSAVADAHLLHALSVEHEKAGAVLPRLAEGGRGAPAADGPALRLAAALRSGL